MAAIRTNTQESQTPVLPGMISPDDRKHANSPFRAAQVRRESRPGEALQARDHVINIFSTFRLRPSDSPAGPLSRS